MPKASQEAVRKLAAAYPWTKAPLIVGAPMRVITGPRLAFAVSNAGGLGFLGPGEMPSDLEPALREVESLVASSPTHLASQKAMLPVGVGFQTWAGDLVVASRTLQTLKPAAVWLFAPRNGQPELDAWTAGIRAASADTQIWIQVASVADAVAAANSSQLPDVLVVQGHDAGGHSLTQGAGIVTLFPEVVDALRETPEIPLVAAGGLIDGRGVAAALVLGAAGAAMGTRFLASHEARINDGYRQHVVQARDGGQSTTRTQLYNLLRGTTNWPAPFDARGLINQSWRDHVHGMPFDENKRLHDEAKRKGAAAWGEKEGRVATYAGTGVGLVRAVMDAQDIVEEVRDGAKHALTIGMTATEP